MPKYTQMINAWLARVDQSQDEAIADALVKTAMVLGPLNTPDHVGLDHATFLNELGIGPRGCVVIPASVEAGNKWFSRGGIVYHLIPQQPTPVVVTDLLDSINAQYEETPPVE